MGNHIKKKQCNFERIFCSILKKTKTDRKEDSLPLYNVYNHKKIDVHVQIEVIFCKIEM